MDFPVLVTNRGTSPLTRGKPRELTDRIKVGGNIPAHAGKTAHRGGCPIPLEEHPRSRGENKRARMSTVMALGTSPLTRGKPWPLGIAVLVPGNIPAHAGKTSLHCEESSQSPEHPRSRGENTRPVPTRPDPSGTSPLTRGKRPRRVGQGARRRNIPAHAGKTRCTCLWCRW